MANTSMLIACADPRRRRKFMELCEKYDPGDGIFGLTWFGAVRKIADDRSREYALDELEVGLLEAELIVLVEHDGGVLGPDGAKAEPGCAEYAFRYGGPDRELEPSREDHLHKSNLVVAVSELRERLWELYRQGKRQKSPENVRFVTLIDHHADGVEEVDVNALAQALGLYRGRCD